MASLEFIAILLSGLSIAASIIYYANVLKNANRTQQMQLETRQAQLFMQIYNRFQDQNFTKMYHEVMNRKWSDVDDYWFKYQTWDDTLLSIQTYFEGIGVLLMKEMINPDFVYEIMPTMVNTLWTKYKPIVLRVREMGYPQYWRPIEYLKDQMIREANKREDPVLLKYDKNKT